MVTTLNSSVPVDSASCFPPSPDCQHAIGPLHSTSAPPRLLSTEHKYAPAVVYTRYGESDKAFNYSRKLYFLYGLQITSFTVFQWCFRAQSVGTTSASSY